MKTILFLFSLVAFFGCNQSVDKPAATVPQPSAIKYPLPETTDSLFSLLKTVPDDTNKINVLNALGKQLSGSNIDSAILLSSQALLICERFPDEERLKAKTLNYIGSYYYFKNDYPHSLPYYQQSLEIYNKLNSNNPKDYSNKKEIAGLLIRIGLVFWNQGDFPKALNYFFDGLKIYDEIKNERGIALTNCNIGLIYEEQKEYSKALDYYNNSLKLAEKVNDRGLQSTILGNLGNVYKDRADFPNATSDDRKNSFDLSLECYTKSLKIAEEVGDKQAQATDLGNIGNVYDDQAVFSAVKPDEKKLLFEKALTYYFNALKLADEIGDKGNVAVWLSNIGSSYASQSNYKSAFDFLYRALAISDSIGAIDAVDSHYLNLSRLYEKATIPLPDSIGGKLLNIEHMRLRALHYFKSYVDLRDTMFSEENKKELVRKEMNYEFDKKENQTKAEQEKKDALTKEELKQKERERNYFIAGFGLVVLLGGFIFRGYRQKQRANEIISEQKLIVEMKQKEILDSIHYAKKIQQSLLPTEKYIHKNLDRLKEF